MSDDRMAHEGNEGSLGRALRILEQGGECIRFLLELVLIYVKGFICFMVDSIHDDAQYSPFFNHLTNLTATGVNRHEN